MLNQKTNDMFLQKKANPAIRYRDHSDDPAVLNAGQEAREFLAKHPLPPEWRCKQPKSLENFSPGLLAE